MANARICDRCGSAFTQRGEQNYHDSNVIRFQHKRWDYNPGLYFSGQDGMYISTHDSGSYDLCPSCAKAFKEFMRV